MRNSLMSDDERLEATASARSSLRRAQSEKMMPSQKTAKRAVDDSMLWESLDCDRIFSPHYVDSCRKKHGVYFDENNQVVVASKTFYAFILTLMMGMAIAVAAFMIQYSSRELGTLRNSALQVMLSENWSVWRIYFYFAGFNLGCVVLAGLLTLIQPTAQDDGVGEIKGYLNGVCLRRIFSAQTLVIKIFGAILGTAGCLVSGAEGSMIHIGAGVASGVTRGNRLRQQYLQFSPSILGIFHNDRDRKDFVCAGAGAGMAAAFGAPVGGMLFALEVRCTPISSLTLRLPVPHIASRPAGQSRCSLPATRMSLPAAPEIPNPKPSTASSQGTSSHFNHHIIWRAFTASIAATIFLDFARSGLSGGNISIGGLLDLGVRDTRDLSSDALNTGTYDAPIIYWEMAFFAVVGILGGICAAVFKVGYRVMSYLRTKEGAVLRLMEVSLLSLVTSSLIFYLSWCFPQCRNLGSWTCMNQERFGSWCSGPSDNSSCVVDLGLCDSTGGCSSFGSRAECVNGTCTLGASSCINASSWQCVGGMYANRPCRPHATECEWQGGVCTPVPNDQIFGMQMRCDVGQYDELATFFFERREWSVRKLVTQAHPHEPFTLFSMLVAAVSPTPQNLSPNPSPQAPPKPKFPNPQR